MQGRHLIFVGVGAANQRWLMGAWSAFFNRDERFRPIPERSRDWNRGAYLVEAAAHCFKPSRVTPDQVAIRRLQN